MTSDSHSRPTPQDMALLHSRTLSPPQYHAPGLLLTNDAANPNGGSRTHRMTPRLPLVPASSMAALPTKKSYDERTRLLQATASRATNRASPTSSSSTSPGPSEGDCVYPWYDHMSPPIPISSSSTDDTTSYHTYDTGGGPSKPIEALSHHNPPTVFIKLLAKAQSSSSLPSASSAPASFNIVGSGNKKPQQQPRRHSILRASSNRSLTDKTLRKSASVEFALHHEALQKLPLTDRRESSSNMTPRRLTFEEKEELYKVRPDLEVGPNPFFKEQMREIEQRNQRRTLFAILGGVLCIMFLMVIYYVLSIA